MKEEKKTARTIYHYCGTDAFLNIINTGSLWVSDARKTNDRQELRWFKELAFNYLKQQSMHDKNLAAVLADIDLHLELIEGISDYYICCFSEERDSVPQWSAYAERGTGFAIGFDVNSLRLAVSAPMVDSSYSIVPGETGSDEWGFGPVFYGEEDANNTQLKHLRMLIDIEPSFGNDAATIAREYIDLVCAFCKHPDFRTEKEWRVVHNATRSRERAGGHTGSALGTRWRRGAYGLTPFVQTPDIKKCIVDVVIGPSNADRGASEYVSQFLRHAGVLKARVIDSGSPYR